MNNDLKVPLFAFNPVYLGAGDKADIEMPADLDQFGRDNSHGTIIGGKGLVQLGHYPANGGGFFQKVDVIA